MTERDILIAGIVALWSSLVAAALYIKHLHDRHGKDQKETIKTITEEMTRGRTAVENNTKVVDKLFDHFQKTIKK